MRVKLCKDYIKHIFLCTNGTRCCILFARHHAPRGRKWGGLNDLYEEIMVAAAPIVDLLDRGNGCFGLYGILDGLYHLAWESLWDARPELEKRLSRRFPVTLEGDNERCGCCR
jgi:hypothetical protein